MTEGSSEATTRPYPDAPPDPAQVIRPSWPAWIGPTAWPAIASNFRRIQAASATHPVRKDPRQRVRLRSGDQVTIRPLCPQDAAALATAVERLSALSRYRRFHSTLPRLTDEMITYFTEIDHHDHEALVAVVPGTGGIIVGVARFIRDPAHPHTAEVAVVVADSWQRRGLGTVLLRRLARRANEVGVRSITGDILAENHPTIKLARRLGARPIANHGSTMTTSIDITQVAVEDSDAGSALSTLVAAEVAAGLRLIHSMLDCSVVLIRLFVVPISQTAWPTSQLIHLDGHDPHLRGVLN